MSIRQARNGHGVDLRYAGYAVNPHRIVRGQRQLARQFAGNDGALRSGVDDEVERPLAINVYWQGDPPRHVPAGGDYGGSAIVALRVVGDRLWRRRSEEHTSELQSLMRISYAVFCLKKNT